MCGGYDSLRESVPFVLQLIDITLLDIKQYNDFDIILEFDKGFHLELISETGFDEHFHNLVQMTPILCLVQSVNGLSLLHVRLNC